MPRQNQHYVWKYYLRSWCNEKGLIHFSRNNGEVRIANPKRIMVEKNFYELPLLNDSDIEFLQYYLEYTKSQSVELELHHGLIIEYHLIVNKYRELIQSTRKGQIDLAVEIGEILHRNVEGHSIGMLDELRQKRKSFLAHDESAIRFFYFLAHQLFRIKKLQDGLKKKQPSYQRRGLYDLSNIANIFLYLEATNLSYALYYDEDGYDVTFLENDDSASFITGDQPVINLLANRQGGAHPEKILLYYALSPNLSCLVANNSDGLKSKVASTELVTGLNGLIAWYSYEFIAGDSERAIELAVKNKPFPNQSVRNILDQLRE